MAENADTVGLSCFQCGGQFAVRLTRGPAKRFCPVCVASNNRRRVADHAARKRTALGLTKKRQGMADHHRLLIGAIRKFVVNAKARCRDCDTPMLISQIRADRCGTCAEQRNAAILRTARSARKRYLRQFAFDPMAVFERDGWTCYLCGTPTPPALRGLNLPTSPEVDHVAPISRGGEHSEVNAKCSCRKCNNQKKAKTPAEYFAWLERKVA